MVLFMNKIHIWQSTFCLKWHVKAKRLGCKDVAHLIVYSRVPLSTSRSSLFGVVMLWATDFFPLWKKVSGVQILLARRLLRGNTCMGPSNFSRSSLQLWRKKTSMVYSWRGAEGERLVFKMAVFLSFQSLTPALIHAQTIQNLCC